MWRLALLVVCTISVSRAEDVTDGPINRAIAETRVGVTVTIPKTGTLMDLGSIFNDLQFSDGRLYRLVFDIPFEFSGNGLRYNEAHFRIVELPFKEEEKEKSEVILHESTTEKKLTSLLESLVSTTEDPHQKKNATTLLVFLRDRKKGFAMGKKWWDFTPWKIDWSKIGSPAPTASPTN